jgi:hypothetical protein
MRRWKLSLVAVLSLCACAGVSTEARMAPGTNLAQYRTFAWAPRTQQTQSLADQAIRSSLEQDLAQKGIVQATQGPPEFYVAYHTKTRQETDVGYYGWGYYGMGYPAFDTYEVGTLVVDFVDPRTRQVFWRGTASATVENPDNPDPNRIANAVNQLMQKYPSQVASAPRPQM